MQSAVADLTLKETVILYSIASNFINERSFLLNNTLRLTKDELPTCDTWVIKLFFYGNDLLDLETSTLILNVFVGFI